MTYEAKRPIGRPPVGAIWLEDEGRYEYTQKYFDLREQALISNRLKAKETQRQRSQMLKDSRPYIWNKSSVRKEDTLDFYISRKTSECLASS